MRDAWRPPDFLLGRGIGSGVAPEVAEMAADGDDVGAGDDDEEGDGDGKLGEDGGSAEAEVGERGVPERPGGKQVLSAPRHV